MRLGTLKFKNTEGNENKSSFHNTTKGKGDKKTKTLNTVIKKKTGGGLLGKLNPFKKFTDLGEPEVIIISES
jgi:hypothetical protein